MMEFHISRKARERYRFADTLFSYNGNVVFANVAACRAFAHQMNLVRDADKNPDLAVHAGQLFAMGLIDEASHVLMARYREQFDPEVMTSALDWFAGRVGTRELDTMLLTFVEHFPGQSVMRGEETPRQWLNGETGKTTHREAALEELLLLWSANRNEAFKKFEELFEDKPLAEKTVYRQVTQELPEYFATRPLIPVEGAKAMSLLRPAACAGGRCACFSQRATGADPQAVAAVAGRQTGPAPDDGRRSSARRRAGHLDAVQSRRSARPGRS